MTEPMSQAIVYYMWYSREGGRVGGRSIMEFLKQSTKPKILL